MQVAAIRLPAIGIDNWWRTSATLTPIPPYSGVWALPGGRIRKHEHLQATAIRVLKEIRIVAEPKQFVGAFPVRFRRHPQKRYDITLCYRYTWKLDEPTATQELVRFGWFSPWNLPRPLGGNYRRVIKAAFSTGTRHSIFQER